jgi:hypothetical protein
MILSVLKHAAVTSRTVTAVHQPSNIYHQIFPEISLTFHSTNQPADTLTVSVVFENRKSDSLRSRTEEAILDQLKPNYRIVIPSFFPHDYIDFFRKFYTDSLTGICKFKSRF